MECAKWATPDARTHSGQCLGTRRIPDLAMLRRETEAWNGEANRKRTKINWRYTRKKARKDFKYEPPPRRSQQKLIGPPRRKKA